MVNHQWGCNKSRDYRLECYSPSFLPKTLKKDAKQNKLTFVSVLGLEKAKQIEQKLTNEAIEALSVFGAKAQTLESLARFIISRDY